MIEKSAPRAPFYTPREAAQEGVQTFDSHPTTALPWGPGSQHGGPPAALLGRAVERLGEDVIGRFTWSCSARSRRGRWPLRRGEPAGPLGPARGRRAVRPQVRIAPSLTPDLVDRRSRIAVECDPWTFHAEQSAFHRDLRRYNTVQLDGWLLLRFDRDHAWAEPHYVRSTLAEAVATRSGTNRLAVGPVLPPGPA